ncbi:histidine phosphatase family protein [Chelativorans sp. AA-79]|uniref:histidine phosphatase family protein n=1 Tax=Chelativorans sp. AA-79 TaxID=3028735 RepID=UPI0023F6FCF8|nr:histidine phosphatase family protein [Chelativorans sp. AA-79]WEX08142.1 histidine phosphatase family protein [Chelativorans sp. AA-79]
MIAYYLTHPQVEIEPERPVPLWRLSVVGRRRVEVMLDQEWLRTLGRIVSSAETKAVEAAAILAAHLHIPMEVEGDMGENDRSSTGFIEPEKFDAAADAFFAEPEMSWRGWERAVDAADRIEAAANRVLKDAVKPVLMVGHGGVGTLLKCRIAGQPIARDRDQPPGGGNIYAFGIASRRLLCDWTPMESFRGVDDVG